MARRSVVFKRGVEVDVVRNSRTPIPIPNTVALVAPYCCLPFASPFSFLELNKDLLPNICPG